MSRLIAALVFVSLSTAFLTAQSATASSEAECSLKPVDVDCWTAYSFELVCIFMLEVPDCLIDAKCITKGEGESSNLPVSKPELIGGTIVWEVVGTSSSEFDDYDLQRPFYRTRYVIDIDGCA